MRLSIGEAFGQVLQVASVLLFAGGCNGLVDGPEPNKPETMRFRVDGQLMEWSAVGGELWAGALSITGDDNLPVDQGRLFSKTSLRFYLNPYRGPGNYVLGGPEVSGTASLGSGLLSSRYYSTWGGGGGHLNIADEFCRTEGGSRSCRISGYFSMTLLSPDLGPMVITDGSFSLDYRAP